jgi:hypothetical protein
MMEVRKYFFYSHIQFRKFKNWMIFELVPKPGWFRNKLLEKPVKARFFP